MSKKELILIIHIAGFSMCVYLLLLMIEHIGMRQVWYWPVIGLVFHGIGMVCHIIKEKWEKDYEKLTKQIFKNRFRRRK